MYEVRSEELVIHAGSKAIFGRIWRPVTDEKCPAIILSHGYNGCHADFNTECRFYAQNGLIAYNLDFCGDSTRSRSTGSSTEMTLFTEKEDLLDVFDHISHMEQVDETAVFLMGGSQGGLVTALAAEERSARGMILYFPAMGIPDNWRGRFGEEKDIPQTFDFWGLTLGKVFFTSMSTFSTYDHIGSFAGPVLILQGDQDGIVRPEVAQRTAEKYADAEVVILASEGHGFTPAGTQFAMEKTLAMMQRSLNK